MARQNTGKIVTTFSALSDLVAEWANSVFPENVRAKDFGAKVEADGSDIHISFYGGVTEQGIRIYEDILNQYACEEGSANGMILPPVATYDILTLLMQECKVIGFALRVTSCDHGENAAVSLMLETYMNTDSIEDICEKSRSITELTLRLHRYSAMLMALSKDDNYTTVFNRIAGAEEKFYANRKESLEDYFPRIGGMGTDTATESLLKAAWHILDMYMTTLATMSTSIFPRMVERAFEELAEEIAAGEAYPPLHIIISAMVSYLQKAHGLDMNPSFGRDELMTSLSVFYAGTEKRRDIVRLLVNRGVLTVAYKRDKNGVEENEPPKDADTMMFDEKVNAVFTLPRAAFAYLLTYQRYERIVHHGDENNFSMSITIEQEPPTEKRQ